MARQPCLPGKHEWSEQVGYKGSRYTICIICETPKEEA